MRQVSRQASRQPRTRHIVIRPPQLRTQHPCRPSSPVTVQVTVSAVDLETTHEASLEAGLEAAQDTSHHHQSTTAQDSASMPPLRLCIHAGDCGCSGS